VYAGTRQALVHRDARVTPVTLDMTNEEQIWRAVETVESLDILINNAGVAMYDDLSDRAVLEQHLAVNLFGTYGVTQAFLPLLTRSRGSIVNVLSDSALGAMPLIPSYSISKAAAFSLTQSLRALLAGPGVTVHAVLPGPVDTDMSRAVDIPKASPESVAQTIFDGVESGEEEIFPNPLSESMAEAGAAARPRRSSVTTRRSSHRAHDIAEDGASGCPWRSGRLSLPHVRAAPTPQPKRQWRAPADARARSRCVNRTRTPRRELRPTERTVDMDRRVNVCRYTNVSASHTRIERPAG
jgi:NAD(P)-dependent dehydrogenase (short-subunit alcohol dehydrogenase family)